MKSLTLRITTSRAGYAEAGPRVLTVPWPSDERTPHAGERLDLPETHGRITGVTWTRAEDGDVAAVLAVEEVA